MQIAPIGKRNGFLWGGDWIKTKDYPHFEMGFGFKTSELLKKYNNGELDNEHYIKIS